MSKDTLTNLANSDKALQIARRARRAAETALARAEATLAKAQENERSLEAEYRAARAAAFKAYPEHRG